MGTSRSWQSWRNTRQASWRWLKTHTEVVLISVLVVTALIQYYFRPQAQSFEQVVSSGELRVLISDEPDSQFVFNKQHFGFEYELLALFAKQHDVELVLQIVPYGELFSLLDAGVADIAVGGIIDSSFVQRVSSPTLAWYKTKPTVVYQRGTQRPKNIEDLQKEPVLASSRYYQIEQLAELNLIDDYRTEYDLLSAVASGKARYALTTNYRALGAKHYLPELNRSFLLPEPLELVWALPKRTDGSLLSALNEFLTTALDKNLPNTLADRYFDSPNRLNRFDALAVHRKISSVLPQFEYAFKKAARLGGIDWQLLAALAYQESRWSNDAVSPTGVRGIMQLTNDTAEFLGVSDRMDMDQSIDAAARYLKFLSSRLPNSISEPERSWFTLAAYNMGLKHVLYAYRKVRAAGDDPTSWNNVAKVLPTLYDAPFSNGVQAKNYVERVQIFTDILRFYDLHLRDIDQFEVYQGFGG